ncbi:hypothetical protein RRG08_053600 [Elysia crispata]|uniref:Uncharacterized protein n=1 Tax=Elysia crispata TaxID=231223 RepID=A0AAE0Y174_9GAST|nr:hypothetical protein RRG08_053600 [Elysia crispata]
MCGFSGCSQPSSGQRARDALGRDTEHVKENKFYLTDERVKFALSLVIPHRKNKTSSCSYSRLNCKSMGWADFLILNIDHSVCQLHISPRQADSSSAAN